jgi:hypothetical protein
VCGVTRPIDHKFRRVLYIPFLLFCGAKLLVRAKAGKPRGPTPHISCGKRAKRGQTQRSRFDVEARTGVQRAAATAEAALGGKRILKPLWRSLSAGSSRATSAVLYL